LLVPMSLVELASVPRHNYRLANTYLASKLAKAPDGWLRDKDMMTAILSSSLVESVKDIVVSAMQRRFQK